MTKSKFSNTLKQPKIVSKEDAPLWMLNNEYLTEGFRVNFKNKRSLVKAMCLKHNEITHIWSHFIGCIIFLILMIALVQRREYNKKVYQELKDEFQKYHLEKFNTEFISDIANFFSTIKNQVQIQNDNQHQAKLKNKIDNYISHLLDFKNILSHKKQKHIKNYEQYVSKNKKEKFLKEINKLKISNKHTNEFYFDEINKIFQQQKSFLLDLFPRIPDLEYFPIIIYILSVVLCLGFSTLYHVFRPLSKRSNDILNRLDQGGISILVFGSSFACSYYIYYCYTHLQLFYTIVEFSTCFSVFVITYLERFNKKEFVHFKGILFGILGLGNGLSLGHAVYLFKFVEDVHTFDHIFAGTVLMGILYLTGLFFFVKKIPEKLVPKKFDIWFNSHTIFHLFVFVAALQYYLTLESLYRLRSVHVCKKQLNKHQQINISQKFQYVKFQLNVCFCHFRYFLQANLVFQSTVSYYFVRGDN